MFILYTTLSFSPFLKWPFYHAKVKVRNKTYLLWLTFWDIEILICVLITGYERKQWGWNCTHFLHVHIAVGFRVHTDVQWVVASVCPCVSMRESMVPAFPRILSSCEIGETFRQCNDVSIKAGCQFHQSRDPETTYVRDKRHPSVHYDDIEQNMDSSWHFDHVSDKW